MRLRTWLVLRRWRLLAERHILWHILWMLDRAGREAVHEGLDEFHLAYMEAALWSSTGPDDEPLDWHYSVSDLSDEVREEMRQDCLRFIFFTYRLIGKDYKGAGHDFWLTRARHGAGFWDGDWQEGDALTEVAHKFPEQDLWPDDDGQLYLQPA